MKAEKQKVQSFISQIRWKDQPTSLLVWSKINVMTTMNQPLPEADSDGLDVDEGPLCGQIIGQPERGIWRFPFEVLPQVMLTELEWTLRLE